MQAQTIPHKKCCRLRRLSIALFFTWCSSILLSELPGEETQKAAPEAAPEEKPPVCLRCNGTAKITCPRCGGSGNLMKDCPTCNGTGKRLCLSCQKYRDKLPKFGTRKPGLLAERNLLGPVHGAYGDFAMIKENLFPEDIEEQINRRSVPFENIAVGTHVS